MYARRNVFGLAFLAALLVFLAGATHASPQEPATSHNDEVAVLAFSYQDRFGTNEEAYPADADHIFTPGGIFVDGSDNVYVTSDRGKRMVAYDDTGAHRFGLGSPGVDYTSDYTFSAPRDLAADGNGHLWVADGNRIVAYDLTTREFVQQLPADDPGQAGDDNAHFDHVIGIAFDSSGRMFVSDQNNHRVQVYTFNNGEPVYQSTIGETGVPGSDNDHFNHPLRLGVDGNDRLYIVDYDNGRVQRCSETMGGWSCATFAGGLTQPGGIDVDGAGNVFVSDRGNDQILQCDSSGACTPFVTNLPGWTVDVAVDSAGHVFATDWRNHVVREFDGSGSELSPFAGTENVPYVTDSDHTHEPRGMATDADGNLYVAEREGQRLLKLAPDGAQLWSVGQPGVWGDDNAHFGSVSTGIEGSPAVDAAGNVYVTDSGNNRVQVFDANGNYVATHGQYGDGPGEFWWPAGIAINPVNGDFIVNDRLNHRVQVFDSNWQHRVTLGVTGEAGNDNNHFNWPDDVATDSQGRIYVADGGNYRVQRCTVTDANYYSCATFAGGSNSFSGSFEYLQPAAVDVDEAGRVYVADVWNYRVQVFDDDGNYLTTVGGEWGSLPGKFRGPAGVAVAPDGTLYISSQQNHTIQKFKRGIDGWEQVNTPGFGKNGNQGVWSVYPYGDTLYASAFNLDSGAEVYRLQGGGWQQVVSGGFGDNANVGVNDFIAFDGMLYAGTWTSGGNGGQIWRSASGDSGSWQRVATSGFGDPANAEVMSLQTFDGYLYAGTFTSAEHGGEIWRSASGDGDSWAPVADDTTFGESGNEAILSMREFDGALYAATSNMSHGGEIWRTRNGTTWAQVNDDGFGNSDNVRIVSLAVHDGALYAGTWNAIDGGQIWHTSNGGDWVQAEGSGFDGSDNRAISSLLSLDGYLYALAANFDTGPEVWRSDDPAGGAWERVANYGIGAGASQAVDWEPVATIYDGTLYVGTFTFDTRAGGRLFRLRDESFVYLPAILN